MNRSRGKIGIAAQTLALSTWILGCAPAAAPRPQPGAEVVLHSFARTDGWAPQAGVIQGSDGNFYGTTGVAVFKLTPSGRLNTLYSFCSLSDCADGTHPAGLIQGSDGNFYGTTRFGGANSGPFPFYPPGPIQPPGYGTAFKLTPSGTLTTLYSFCNQANCADGDQPVAGLIQGSDGNFYGFTRQGGANQSRPGLYGKGTVFKVTPSGGLSTLYSFCRLADCVDGYYPSGRLIQGSDGNFYGTTSGGGVNDYGTVFKLTPSGTLTTLYSFSSQIHCADGRAPSGVIQGSDGNFYGTTCGGAHRAGTVFKLTPSGTLTALYSFCSVRTWHSCLDGAGPEAGVIQGSDGNFYGTTDGGGTNDGGTVFELRPSGRLTTLYSFCSQKDSYVCTDGDRPEAGVIQGSDGNFYGTAAYGGAHDHGTVFKVSATLPTSK